METRLLLTEETTTDQIILTISGRLDANNASYLDDKLSELAQKGNYKVALHMQGIDFLSSAGIRILVKQNKAFRAISGELTILVFSENVKSVLDMVGMVNLFLPKDAVKKTEQEQQTENGVLRSGFLFSRVGQNKKTKSLLHLQGHPEKMATCSFNREDNQLIRLDKPWFGLGVGAFGQDFEDCSMRYGEFVALGDSIVTLPSDHTVTPDDMVRSGNLVPEINSLYSVGIDDGFQQEIHFTPELDASITLGTIAETVAEMGAHKDFALLMIGESNGLVGASLKTSPTTGKNPFHFPEVRESIKFTTEPAYIKEMTVSFGIFSLNPNEQLKPFLRPLSSSSKLCAHVHTVIFTYKPLRKENPEYHEVLKSLLENSAILDVLHLLNDERQINGIGESSFRSGLCWSAELELKSFI
jgi:anti-anti-sigma factor